MKRGSKPFFRAGAGHGPKRACAAVPEIFGSVVIPLLECLKHQAVNFVLPKQVKIWGDHPLRLSRAHLNQWDRPGEWNHSSQSMCQLDSQKKCVTCTRPRLLFAFGDICPSPRQDGLWFKAFFKGRAGHELMRTRPSVPKMFIPVDNPLLGHLRYHTLILVLSKQV